MFNCKITKYFKMFKYQQRILAENKQVQIIFIYVTKEYAQIMTVMENEKQSLNIYLILREITKTRH